MGVILRCLSTSTWGPVAAVLDEWGLSGEPGWSNWDPKVWYPTKSDEGEEEDWDEVRGPLSHRIQMESN